MTRWTAVLVVVLAAAAAAAAADSDVEAAAESPESYLAKGEATGRTFSEWGQAIMEWMGFDYDDYDDYDYNNYDYQLYYPGSASAQVGYGLPSVGHIAPSASGQSSYSSYQPYQVVPHPNQFSYNARDDDVEESSWSFGDILFNAAIVGVPLLALGSALPASFMTVAIRRRSFDDGSEIDASLDPSELPLLHEILEAQDFTPLLEPRCQRKLFCELTKIGESENASFMQRAFYYVATLTPDPIARRVGLVNVFRAARNDQCETLICRDPPHLSSLSPPAAHPPSNHLPEDSSSSTSDPDAEE
ncbi:uncharacterized protein LOC126985944 [Eriocheir sinensis]|uniref:uncharacterized protein LOC126985944 n=1 Tax=Eriocheir sinensis TaxID=95602 RepID=UPI0021C81CF1|nr:uncharacterized protein LOC126985944 [Eriocheir sinensis]